MEQDLNSYKDLVIEKDELHFKLQHKNQDLKNNMEFKKWYEDANKYIQKENEKLYAEHEISIINFCSGCCSYSIFRMFDFSWIKCQNCDYKFCIGCGRKPLSNNDYSTCLKGYFKSVFLRLLYENTVSIDSFGCFFHIIFTLFFTPFYIAFIFNFLGFLSHQRNSRLDNNNEIKDFINNKKKIIIICIYSIMKGFLFFPYIIIFLPFMIILLLPSIFSEHYYLKLFWFSLSVARAGGISIMKDF